MAVTIDGLNEAEYFEANERLIWHFVNIADKATKKSYHIDQEELFMEGTCAFLKAFRKFDESKGVKFSSFAGVYVIGQVKRILRDKSRIVRVPRTDYQLYVKICYYINQNYDFEQTAEKLNLPYERVKQVYYTCRNDVKSLNSFMSNGDDEDAEHIDFLESDCDYTAMFVDDFISTLTNNEQIIIKARLKGESQRQIAKRVDVSQVQVSRILKRIGQKYEEYRED